MRSFEPFDLLSFEFVSDPQLDPAGDRVAYVRHTVEPEDDEYRAQIWICSRGEEGGRAFTGASASDTHPRWSPDGRWLAFLSNRPVSGTECGSQIWVIPLGGGEALPLTCIDGGVSAFAWSPGGGRIALVARCDPAEGIVAHEDDDPDPQDRLQRLYQKYNEDIKHIKKIKYKADGAGFLEGKRAHVGVVPFIAGDLSADGFAEVVDVTPGDFDHSSPAWSPDGRWIAASSCRANDPDVQRFSDIWLFCADGEGEPVKVTDSSGPASSPSFSRDGRRIAYLGNRREITGGYTNTRMWIADVGDRVGTRGDFTLTDLTKGTDVTFGDRGISDMRFSGPAPDIAWSPDGGFLYHVTSERGTTQVVRVDAETGACRLVTTGDRVIFNAHLRPDLGVASLAVADALSPAEIRWLELCEPVVEAGLFSDDVLEGSLQKAPERTMVVTNEELLAQCRVLTPERFTARATGDDPDVDVWVIRPDGDQDRLPAVLQIHGGPTAMYTGTFFFEFQLLAAAGYAVVFTNPRGSSGYGEAFRGAIAPGWGDLDYADITAGLDEALKRYPELDETRLGVAGGSYGGYMTNWIIGHTDRFRAAVTMRCVSNLHSFWGTSDIGFMWDERYGGHPWETAENYRQQSPITYMGDVKTPTLVIHSEADHRCPVEQGEQVFATLKKQGVESEFIRYPGESHGLSRGGRPWHRIHRLERIMGWFDRYI